AVSLDFSTGSYTHSVRFAYMKFRNAITDAVTGTSVFNPFPASELGIGQDFFCLTPGADEFCSGPNILAPQATIQSNRQIKYDGSKAYKSHIFRYGVGFNHLQGGGFAKFFGIAPAVGSTTDDCQSLPSTYPVGQTCNTSDLSTYLVMDVLMGIGEGFASEKPSFG